MPKHTGSAPSEANGFNGESGEAAIEVEDFHR
jgi:hypothetical protein